MAFFLTTHAKRRFTSSLFLTASLCLLPAAALAQSSHDPLDNKQVEEVRETGDQPVERIKLYMKYIEQRTAEIHKLASDPRAQMPNARLHNLMEEFTRLSDELQDNLETYSEEHADMRKTLKELVEHTGKWKASLQEPKASSDYDFARKTALDTADSTTDLAQKVLDAQEKYFATHKPPK
jgi:exonuclease VII large subunit